MRKERDSTYRVEFDALTAERYQVVNHLRRLWGLGSLAETMRRLMDLAQEQLLQPAAPLATVASQPAAAAPSADETGPVQPLYVEPTRTGGRLRFG